MRVGGAKKCYLFSRFYHKPFVQCVLIKTSFVTLNLTFFSASILDRFSTRDYQA